MILTEQALEAINKPEVRLPIAMALGVNEQSVRTKIWKNEENGDLTKEAVLLIIEDKTGLSRDKILTEEAHA